MEKRDLGVCCLRVSKEGWVIIGIAAESALELAPIK